jgi:hypothetical protein
MNVERERAAVMKIYGYKDEGLAIEEIQSEELAEITLVATPEELRKISRFIESAANEIEQWGRGFSHEHLSDKQPGFKNSPHFVVFNPDAAL